MKKALIINEGFSNNLGDQAIRESMTSLLRDSDFSTDFAYFTNPGMNSMPAYNYLEAGTGAIAPPALSFAKKAKLKLAGLYWIGINYKHIRAKLRKGNYDIVVIGGGQLIESSGKDYPSRFAIAMYWWTLLVKKFTRAKIYIIGVGVGTTFNAKEQSLFSKALSKADLIWVRDSYSKASLFEKFGHKAVLTPDIAFYSGKNRIEEENTNRKALVGITSFNEVFAKYNQPGKTNADYYEEWFAVVKGYLDAGLSVELFYTTITDAAETIAFRNYIKLNYHLELPVAKLSSVNDLKQLYQSASDVYSGRMHALILAMKHQCTVKAYLISQKLKSFHQEYILPGNQPTEYSRKIRGTFNDLMLNNVKP
ncbi:MULTISPECIES: polysaccharide pyruvyl transferase family protein [unclassified Chitinophaga]|uniref:polysaccharide pyruvyl transferase family protein n=1 Tax=unclassified Chitinophaga TaxID=2619133 RepID=UPI00300F8E66